MDAEKRMMQKRIDNLCEQLEIVKRERDALRYDMQLLSMKTLCDVCAYDNPDEDVCKRSERVKDCFMWRGLCEENGGKTDG